MDQNTLFALIAAGLVLGIGMVLLSGGSTSGSGGQEKLALERETALNLQVYSDLRKLILIIRLAANMLRKPSTGLRIEKSQLKRKK